MIDYVKLGVDCASLECAPSLLPSRSNMVAGLCDFFGFSSVSKMHARVLCQLCFLPCVFIMSTLQLMSS